MAPMGETSSVGISIDTSEPLLFNSGLARLITAVLSTADPNDEHDWIEWKRRLDLGGTSAQQHIAKHVLGMANRMVSAAAVHMGGYGYIVIGVEPHSITGVDTIDPTEMTDAIQRYVGTDGPRWTFEYVTVEEHVVLVVVVWPPQHGDPVHTLRHRLENHEPGRVLVRRPGQTKEASPAEHAALVERAKANRNTITVAARLLRETIETGPVDLPAYVESVVAAERELLMHASRSTRPSTSPPTTPESSWTTSPGGSVQFRQVSRPGREPTHEEDHRTEGQYAHEVERYLRSLRTPLTERITNRRWRRPSGMLHLAMDNLTSRNFAQVRVKAHISGAVRTWPESLVSRIEYLPSLPSRPRRLGERRLVPSAYDRVARAAFTPQVVSNPFPATTFPSSSGFTARDGGSVDIEFAPIHLHPHTPTELPPVELLVDEPPGTQLTLTWTATSESADGLATGALTLVVGEPAPFDDVFSSNQHDVS